MSIQELRYKTGLELGLRNARGKWTGTAADYSDLNPTNQIRLNAAMKEYIRRHPDEFTAQQVQTANLGDPSEPVEYTFAEKLSDFSGEFLNQGERINPFSAANWPTVRNVIIVGFMLWATVKILPHLKK